MTTFGFSAFLKLVNLNARPRRTEIRGRLHPSGGGYDFHKATRSIARSFVLGEASREECLAQAATIVKLAERTSATAALGRLFRWRDEHPGAIRDVREATYESPAGIFRVKLAPDFAIAIGGQMVAVHLWNTMRPPLEGRLTRAALSLLAPIFGEEVDDLAVLSLRNSELYRLGDPAALAALAARIVEEVEETFIDLRDEDGRPAGEVRPAP